MLGAYIVTGSANDYIEGYSLTKEASGISNQGIIGTGNGNDFIYGSASAGGTRFGLENDGGIVTGSSVGSPDEDCDTIIGSGQNTIGGGVAEARYECKLCTYLKVSLSLGFKNLIKEDSYPKSATPWRPSESWCYPDWYC